MLDLQPLHLERGQVPEHELAVPGHGGDRAPGGLVPGVVPGVGELFSSIQVVKVVDPVGNKREAWDLPPRHFQILGTFTGTFRALGPSS